MSSPPSRTKTEYKVKKVEFDMGKNDVEDVRAGGPLYLSFWVYTDLENDIIEELAKSSDIQMEIKRRGGSGAFTISEEWVVGYVKTSEEFKKSCLELAKEFF